MNEIFQTKSVFATALDYANLKLSVHLVRLLCDSLDKFIEEGEIETK